jgi:hypothetical protein
MVASPRNQPIPAKYGGQATEDSKSQYPASHFPQPARLFASLSAGLGGPHIF